MTRLLAIFCCVVVGCAPPPQPRQVLVTQDDISIAKARGLIPETSAQESDLLSLSITNAYLSDLLLMFHPGPLSPYSLDYIGSEDDPYKDIRVTVTLTNAPWIDAVAAILMRCDLRLKQIEPGARSYRVEARSR